MPLSYLDKIMKLLELGGRGNSNPHERAIANEKAEALMQRHGVSREDMRERYRQEHGLPARTAPRAPKPPAPAPDPVELERLRQAALAAEHARQQREARSRLQREQAERARAEAERTAREALTARLRAAFQQSLASHPDFTDFIDHLATLGIQIVLGADEPPERMVFRWPPSRVALRAAQLGAEWDWPALLDRGLRYDARDLRHRQTLALMVIK